MKRKVYDLEERTHLFAKNCRLLLYTLPKTIANYQDSKQLIKSSGLQLQIISKLMKNSETKILNLGLKSLEKKQRNQFCGLGFLKT